ncbi:hypothetical protein OGATHE_006519 [Ogataea polymorpha]|uniref:Uncharacterized protein n=1 Tax=Ogataea polymorpha TaxID=460523 RepID=A0A9P8NP94_9ASCO|nr:hypothetical protein OGATHE_006519 [Ogataea polymorpha]
MAWKLYAETTDGTEVFLGGCELRVLGKSFHPPTSFFIVVLGGGGGVMDDAKDGCPGCGDFCSFNESSAVLGAYGLAATPAGTEGGTLVEAVVATDPARDAAALYGLNGAAWLFALVWGLTPVPFAGAAGPIVAELVDWYAKTFSMVSSKALKRASAGVLLSSFCCKKKDSSFSNSETQIAETLSNASPAM